MTDTATPGFASRVHGMGRVLRVLILLGLGAVAALGQAPWGLWPLTIVALALLFALFRQSRDTRHAAWTGWIAGCGYFMVALSWIVEPFLVDVARHGWMAPFALLGLAAGMALFWAAAYGIARAVNGGAIALIAAFTLAEATRGVLFTGFPWAQIGHVLIESPLLQWASLTGALGLTALVVALAAALWHFASGHRLHGVAWLVALPLVSVIAPGMLAPAPITHEGAPLVRLIQPNAAQHEKWDPEMIPVFFKRQLDYSTAGNVRPDLIVWPETSVPVLLNAAGSTFASISDAAGGVPVVVGVQRRDDARLYNSLAVLGQGGEVSAVYDKHHLVPFGEFMPFGNTLSRFGISGLASRDGNGYSAGPGAQVLDIGTVGKALPLICYEGVFARDVMAAPERPDFMMLITNDAWFGEVSGPYQHLAQARLRSVEQGLPMIRAANTGISAVINANGVVTAELALGEAGYLDAFLPPPHPPTFYARSGDIPILVLLALILGASVLIGRRTRT